MVKEKYPSDKQDQFMIRFPDGMRDKLKELASINGRSLNAEIIDLIQTALEWPTVKVPAPLREEALEVLPFDVLDSIEDEIKLFAVQRLATTIENLKASRGNLYKTLMDMLDHVPEDERERIKAELNRLLRGGAYTVQLP